MIGSFRPNLPDHPSLPAVEGYGLLSRGSQVRFLSGALVGEPVHRLPANPEKQRLAEAASCLSEDDIDLLLNSSLPLRSWLIYEVAIFTGLRAGERWGLKWEALELEGRSPGASSGTASMDPRRTTRRAAFSAAASPSCLELKKVPEMAIGGFGAVGGSPSGEGIGRMRYLS